MPSPVFFCPLCCCVQGCTEAANTMLSKIHTFILCLSVYWFFLQSNLKQRPINISENAMSSRQYHSDVCANANQAHFYAQGDVKSFPVENKESLISCDRKKKAVNRHIQEALLAFISVKFSTVTKTCFIAEKCELCLDDEPERLHIYYLPCFCLLSCSLLRILKPITLQLNCKKLCVCVLPRISLHSHVTFLA